ncbi:hypothetical protein BK634_10330 [Pseudomonas chlororaphis]|jgi:hypothetical protein|nr:hypothetical protein BK634_10330 [Pseudomonas chlororaphis]
MKGFSFVIETFETEETARFLAAISIGLLKSVLYGVMSLEEAERLLFTPRTSKILRAKGLSPEICDLVMDCCELEDVLSLVPLKFEEELRRMIGEFSNFLKKTEAQDPYEVHTDLR